MDGKSAIDRLQEQLIQTTDFTAAQRTELSALLADAIEQANTHELEVLTVMNPVARPVPLKLHVVVADTSLDPMYGQERAELAVSHDGVCYLVYRRADGGDYAVVWSPATLMPTTTMPMVPAVLLAAMMGVSG